MICSQYVYFIPLLALTAAVGSLEIELYAGVGEHMVLNARIAAISRLLSVALELLVPVLFYMILFAVTGAAVGQWLILFAMVLVVGYLGANLGFAIGFKHEKAINNVIYAITWILAFGLGPLLESEPKWYQAAFPGAQAAAGDYAGEMVKLFIYALIGFWLSRRGRLPRPYRIFSK